MANHARESVRPGPEAGFDSMSEVIDLYRRDVDVTLLRSRLRMSVEERFADLERMQRLVAEMRRAGRAARGDGA
jgi:hypothetical protein